MKINLAITLRKKSIKLLLVLSLIFHCAHAKQNNVINLATYLEPPYANFVNDEFVGINVDITKAIAHKLNKSINYINCPFARCMSLMKDGTVDMIVGIKKTDERSQYVTYLDAPYNTQYYPLKFFVRKDSEFTIEKYEDLKNLRIGTIRGALYFEQFDNDKALNKVEVLNYYQLIQLVLKERIDTFLEREESITPWITTDMYLNHIRLAQYQYNKAVESYIAISKNSPLIVELASFNQAQQTLLDAKQIQSIFTHWQKQNKNLQQEPISNL